MRIKLMTIEATENDLKVSRTLGEAFNNLLRNMFTDMDDAAHEAKDEDNEVDRR